MLPMVIARLTIYQDLIQPNFALMPMTDNMNVTTTSTKLKNFGKKDIYLLETWLIGVFLASISRTKSQASPLCQFISLTLDITHNIHEKMARKASSHYWTATSCDPRAVSSTATTHAHFCH